jgi:hypothetical protein
VQGQQCIAHGATGLSRKEYLHHLQFQKQLPQRRRLLLGPAHGLGEQPKDDEALFSTPRRCFYNYHFCADIFQDVYGFAYV